MTANLRTVRGERRGGTVTVWLVVCLAVIIGIVALGLDGGRMMEERRHVQAAADAAALAAAADLYTNWWQNHGSDPNNTAAAAALASAAANGYANDGTTSTVTVNVPPTTGPFAGQAEYVEVVVQSRLQGSFSALFTRDALPVQARAVARGRPSNVGLLLLQASGTDSLSASGNASVQVSNASIEVNASSSEPYGLSGNASVTAQSHDVAGSQAPGGNVVGTVNTSVPALPDPLASLAEPSTSDYPLQATSTTSLSGNDSATLQPGVYRGGLSLAGNASVTLAAGVYILDGGGLQMSGNASLTGQKVMIYTTGDHCGGGISLSGNGNVSLSAPTDGPYQGIALFQDRTSTDAVHLSGNGSIQIDGALYAAAAAVQISGNGSASGNTVGAFIVNNVQLTGNARLSVNQGSNRMRIPEVGLVE